jgi:hypothetical protein
MWIYFRRGVLDCFQLSSDLPCTDFDSVKEPLLAPESLKLASDRQIDVNLGCVSRTSNTERFVQPRTKPSSIEPTDIEKEPNPTDMLWFS